MNKTTKEIILSITMSNGETHAYSFATMEEAVTEMENNIQKLVYYLKHHNKKFKIHRAINDMVVSIKVKMNTYIEIITMSIALIGTSKPEWAAVKLDTKPTNPNDTDHGDDCQKIYVHETPNIESPEDKLRREYLDRMNKLPLNDPYDLYEEKYPYKNPIDYKRER